MEQVPMQLRGPEAVAEMLEREPPSFHRRAVRVEADL